MRRKLERLTLLALTIAYCGGLPFIGTDRRVFTVAWCLTGIVLIEWILNWYKRNVK